MAERRMFSKTIIDSDAFLDMPLSAQALYFHLSMRADDDGFLNNANKIIRMINASKNDYDLLLIKKFIIQFDDGICVIKHWRIHNYIRNDRYKPTVYQDEMNCLTIKDNKSYTLNPDIPTIEEKNNDGIPNGYQTETQDRIGKDRIGKDRLDKNNVDSTKVESSTKVQLEKIISAWNELNLSRIISIKNTRLKLLNARLKEYGLEKVVEAINNISKSKFLKGQNDTGWTITFDWFVKPNNFPKVLEGNYTDKTTKNTNVKSTGFNNFESREYDYDDLEKKLLGWDTDKE